MEYVIISLEAVKDDFDCKFVCEHLNELYLGKINSPNLISFSTRELASDWLGWHCLPDAKDDWVVCELPANFKFDKEN